MAPDAERVRRATSSWEAMTVSQPRTGMAFKKLFGFDMGAILRDQRFKVCVCGDGGVCVCVWGWGGRRRGG